MTKSHDRAGCALALCTHAQIKDKGRQQAQIMHNAAAVHGVCAPFVQESTRIELATSIHPQSMHAHVHGLHLLYDNFLTVT